MEMLNFSASLIQFSVSHDPSEIFFICWHMLQAVVLLNMFVESDPFYSGLFDK